MQHSPARPRATFSASFLPSVPLTSVFLLLLGLSLIAFAPARKPPGLNPDCPFCAPTLDRPLPIPPDLLALLSAGHAGALAGLSHLSAIGYFGTHSVTDKQFPYLYDYFARALDLDPRFEAPARMGAVLLLLETGEITSGMRLLNTAETDFPDEWFYPFLRGYAQWKMFDDPAAASLAFARASELPGAPQWIGGLAAAVVEDRLTPEQKAALLRDLHGIISDETRLSAVTERLMKQEQE